MDKGRFLLYYLGMKFWQHFKHFFVPHEGNDYKPHVLREIWVLIFLFTALATFAGGLLHREVITKSDFLAAIYSSVLVDLANQDRAQNSVSMLVVNPLLVKAAEMKAEDMAKKGYFAHYSPDGKAPWDWIKLARYSYTSAGENLAIDFTDSTDVNNAWMNSPGHRANLLNQRYTEIGIATKEGIYQGRQTTFVVEMFANPSSVALAPTPIKTEALAVANPVPEQPVVAPSNIQGAETEVFPSEAPVQEAVLTERVGEPQGSKLKTMLNLLLSNPRYLLNGIYGLLALIVLIGLGGLFTIELERHHYKHIAYGFLMLAIIFSLGYIYKVAIFTSAIVAA